MVHIDNEDRFNASAWVEKLDDLLSSIRRQGLKVGLLKTQTGVKLYVENTVCKEDSKFKKDITTSSFNEIVVKDLDYEAVDTDTVCLVGFLNSLASRTKSYGFVSLSVANDAGVLMGNGIPDEVRQGTLFYDDKQAESYTEENKNTKWYPIVEKFVDVDGNLSPVFYNRDILQLGITDMPDKSKMYFIIYAVTDYDGYIIRDGQWTRWVRNKREE